MNSLDKKIEDISKDIHQTSTHDRKHPQQRQHDNEMQYNATRQQQQKIIMNLSPLSTQICGMLHLQKNHQARHCLYRPGHGQLHRQWPNDQYERPWRPRNNRFQQQVGAQQFEQQQQDAYENNQPQPWNEAVSNDCE